MATLIVSPAAPSERELDAPLRSLPAVKRVDRIAQTIVLVMVLAAPAFICLHSAFIADSDIWWHIRTGEWILQHHAVPHVDFFSNLAGTPWMAYSWLFELVTVKLFQSLGLVGIVAYSTGMVFAITFAMYHLVRRLQPDFSLGILLTFVSMYSMGHLFTPRPWLFTILFFVLELDILMQARRTGKRRELLWLPAIFALWANVHIQFMYGLFVLGLALAEALLARRWKSAQSNIGPLWLAAALIASMLATLVNPYGWHMYGVALDLAKQAGAMNKITELQAIPFRSLADFAVLALALGSAAALGWQRRLASFEGALLVFAAALAFRSQRDVWVMAALAATILASSLSIGRDAASKLPRPALGLAAIAAALTLVAGFSVLHVSNQKLQAALAIDLPVKAVETIRQRGYSGPLYNDFNWGGYLIWNLRMPVALDGRQNLYGDRRMDRSVATWSGEPDWASDPQLASAALVIGPATAPLTQLLRMDSRFRIAYEDKVAAVFVARK